MSVCTEAMAIGNVSVSGLNFFFNFLSVLVTSEKLIWISKGETEGPNLSVSIQRSLKLLYFPYVGNVPTDISRSSNNSSLL